MSVTDKIVFFTARTTNGNSSAFPMAFPNREGQLNIFGTFDGSTVKLKYSPDGGSTYIVAKDVFGNDISFTANGGIPIKAPLGELLLCEVTSAGASTSINAELVVI